MVGGVSGPESAWTDLDWIWNFDEIGCAGQVNYLMEQETQANSLFQSDEFRPLFDAIDQFYADLMASPEFVALDSEWSYCMADAGHPNLIRPESVPPQEVANTDQEHADRNCQIATDYENRVRDIVFNAEHQFIADHRTELEAFRAAAEQRN